MNNHVDIKPVRYLLNVQLPGLHQPYRARSSGIFRPGKPFHAAKQIITLAPPDLPLFVPLIAKRIL